MRTIYEVDADGFMTYQTMEIDDTEEIPSGFIDVPLPTDNQGHQLPFWRPRWTGTEWVEDKTREEFEEEAMLESLNPTQQQITDAELEIKILNTLMEVDLI